MKMMFFGALALFIAPPALAQTGAFTPDKHNAARILVDHLYPEWRRAKVIDTLAKTLFAQQLQGNNDLRHSLGVMNLDVHVNKDSRYSELRQKFIERLTLSAQNLVSENFDNFLNAVTAEYAVSLTLEQIEEVDRFISSPIGDAYLRASEGATASSSLSKMQIKLKSVYNERVQADIEWLRAESRTVNTKGNSHDQ